MKQQDFNLILKNLDSLIKRCDALKKDLETTPLQNMSVADYNKIIDRAIALQREQDKVTSSELYHILGMGNLTVTQQATFVSKIKGILNTRYAVKFVASQPHVTVGTQKPECDYTSILLSGKKLVAQN